MLIYVCVWLPMGPTVNIKMLTISINHKVISLEICATAINISYYHKTQRYHVGM